MGERGGGPGGDGASSGSMDRDGSGSSGSSADSQMKDDRGSSSDPSQAQDRGDRDKSKSDSAKSDRDKKDDTARSDKDKGDKAADKSDRKDDKSSASTGKSEGTDGSASGPKLTSEQKTKVQSSFRGHKDKSVRNLDIDINVGVAIPRSVTLYAVPEDVVVIVPGYSRYKYFVYEETVVIVDPDTYEIVDVIVLT